MMSNNSKLETTAVMAVIMAMVFASGYPEDAPAALNMASTTCAEGEVPDGLHAGNCVACDTCIKYPDSPYCALCGNVNPGKITKTPDQWKVGVGVGVPAALVSATLVAVLLYKLYRRRQVLAKQETGADSTEPSIPIQVEGDAAGSGDLAETTPSSVHPLQPSDEQMPLVSHDDNAATVPK
ncbi:Hypp2603 [Branchiostoma lanceolatum]|uniref:Hypp2603 protein n=1 Tax=Branchiostoma lanceolatum TaxID=7740 RepID=A0A8J9ZT62_BRALA|nr:Hypp2603 [Branchiostoma lanceolatum]